MSFTDILGHLLGLGEPILEAEIASLLATHLTPTRRAQLAGPLADLFAALQKGDNAAAAHTLVQLLLKL